MSKFVVTNFFRFIQLWNDIWFQDKNTVPLEVIRIGLGFLLFFNYGLYSPNEIIMLYGDTGLLSFDVIPHMTQANQFSLFSIFEQPWQLLTFHYFFVFICLCFCLGWQTRWIKWLVLIGQMSYMNRNGFAFYGVDIVLLLILLPLCIAPIGRALSVDRLRKIDKTSAEENLVIELPTSQIGFACQRLIQLQMTIIFFSSGIEKLRGELWWSGEAPWFALVNNSTAFFPVDIIAHQFWLVNIMAYGTILIEISYAFLIWGKKTRPYLLAAALLLHLGIAVLLGMYFFAAVMAFGHLAFVHRHWYTQAEMWWGKNGLRLSWWKGFI